MTITLSSCIDFMARRKSTDPVDQLLLALPQVVGLVLLAVYCVPGARHALGSALVVLAWVAGVVVGLCVFISRRSRRGDIDFLTAPTAPAIAQVSAAPMAPRSVENERHWTLELLGALEWKRYEDIVAEYTKHLGLESKTTRIGADGGIDVHIYEPGNPRPVMIVQCKAWDTYLVGVKPMRELYGVMAAEQVKEGAFFTTSDFTSEARDFARGKQLDLVDGKEFLSRIQHLSSSAQSELLQFATAGDYTTPTCPNCGIKMIPRQAKKGPNAGTTFWGCQNYPRCKRVFQFSLK